MDDFIEKYTQEIDHIESDDFKLGKYIYLGMGDCNGHKCCISVAYKIDYCCKKAIQFVKASNKEIVFTHVSKVKVGNLTVSDYFRLNDPEIKRKVKQQKLEPFLPIFD